VKTIAVAVALTIALVTIGRSLWAIRAEWRQGTMQKAIIAQEIEVIALCGVVVATLAVWPWSALAGAVLCLASGIAIYLCQRIIRLHL